MFQQNFIKTDNYQHPLEHPNSETTATPTFGKDMEHQGFSFLTGGNAKWQPLWKTIWWFLTKVNILLLYDPAIEPLGIYPKELKN